MRLVLDTNAYVALMRGERGIADLLESADTIGIPTVVLGELFAGFLIGERAERNLRELDAFMADAGVEVLEIGRREAERYGALVKALRDIGRPIPTNDIWIAAAALCADARLLTADSHFSEVPGLVAIGWHDGV
ncbi:MAG: type II toxin-antitoxin system VapC family toxin [Rectinemataceae bacterium]